MVPPQGNFYFFQNQLRGSCSPGRASESWELSEHWSQLAGSQSQRGGPQSQLGGPQSQWEGLRASGRASEPVGRASEPAGRASEPAGRASEPAGSASEPAERAPKPAGRASEPGRRPGGGTEKRERKKNRAFTVCGGTIGHRPLRGRCPKGLFLVNFNITI